MLSNFILEISDIINSHTKLQLTLIIKYTHAFIFQKIKAIENHTMCI